MKSKILAILLLAGSSMFAGPHVFFGISAGPGYGYYAPPPPPPPPVFAYRPIAPGPGYVWVDGYHYWAGSRYAWRSGYWGRPPYARSYWVAPRYYGHRYYRGYWDR